MYSCRDAHKCTQWWNELSILKLQKVDNVRVNIEIWSVRQKIDKRQWRNGERAFKTFKIVIKQSGSFCSALLFEIILEYEDCLRCWLVFPISLCTQSHRMQILFFLLHQSVRLPSPARSESLAFCCEHFAYQLY